MSRRRLWPFSRPPKSLNQQISVAQRRLDERHREVAVRALALRSHIRSTSTSPGGLWLAGCVGFLAAEWIHRPGIRTRLATDRPPTGTQPDTNADQSKTALLIELAMDLGVLWAKVNQRHTTENKRQ